MTANKTLLTRKYSHVISKLAELEDIEPRAALHKFYKSLTYHEMREGISDMHCRSEAYLAEEVSLEYIEQDPSPL